MLFLFFVVSLPFLMAFKKWWGQNQLLQKSSGGMSHPSHLEITPVQQSLSRNYPSLT